MLPNLVRQFVIGCLLLGAMAAAVLLWFDSFLNKPLPVNEQHTFVVKSGSNLTQVVTKLAAENQVSLPKVLLGYARATQQTAIKAGEYQLQQGDTPVDLLAMLTQGDVILHQVTFPEGLTVKQWLARLAETEELNTANLSKELSFVEGHPEGWLYPDTYRFQSGASAESILKQAHQQMQQRLDSEWQNRAEGLPYKTPYEALIMASIIEKETGAAYERAKIAGVFVRRLQKGMRLQTDPTVIYGLGDSYKGNITRAHLRQKTPYNTYTIHGLPPTPIANPGGDAIHAALHPEAGTELFFVAKGDGSHYFSTTLAEHEKAVTRYQRRRVKNYQSRPKQ